MPGRWGECRFISDLGLTGGHDDEDRAEPHSRRAYVGDASGYAAYIKTTSDFGCVEHEVGPVLGLPDEWSALLGVTVLDPDGWDRTSFAESWAEPITLDEFIRRAQVSTCRRRPVDTPPLS